ncbi:MAG: cellulase family glycosylhydrolase [Acidimicrobiales bacterium]
MSLRRRSAWRLGAPMVAIATCVAMAAGCVPSDVSLHRFPPAAGAPVVSVEAPDTVAPLRMVRGRLVDGVGRVVLLHGMNSVNKSAPYISLLTDGGLGPLDRAYLRTNGFDAVRLGVSYAALMPTAGSVDSTYLDRVVAVVDALSADGLWVQLDFHQDVFTGMPDWATPPDALALSPDPPEFLASIGWAAAYTSPRSIRQWDSFLAGETTVPVVGGPNRSVASLLGDAAAALAARVRDRDHVIGIELLNEPFSGSAVLRCILEGCGDVEGLLADRYAEMTTAIRAVAPEMPVWEEPFAPTAIAAPGGLPARPVPATAHGPQVGLAFHLYCAGTDGGTVEEAPGGTVLWCEHRFDAGLAAGADMAAGLDGPALLNEFGASQNPLDVTLVGRRADAGFVSWMYWHYQAAESADDSGLPDEVESQIVRSYPQATAGSPRSLAFDPATGRMDYTYTPDASIALPTSIVVPRRHYPAGYDVTVSHGVVTSAPQSGRLTVVGDGSGLDVRVVVTRR